MWTHLKIWIDVTAQKWKVKAIGNIYCMNVCLSTVWSATAFWFTCMPVSNGPHIPLLTDCFYFWCFIVTSQRNYQSRSDIECVCKPATYLWKRIITGINAWTISRNVSPENYLETNSQEPVNLQMSWLTFSKKYNFLCVYDSLTTHLPSGRGPPAHVSTVWSPVLLEEVHKQFLGSCQSNCQLTKAEAWPEGYFITFCRDRLASGSPACRPVSAQLASH